MAGPVAVVFTISRRGSERLSARINELAAARAGAAVALGALVAAAGLGVFERADARRRG